jgi:hypothetical protein
MAETTFVGDDAAIVQTTPAWGGASWSAVSWSAVIAGALTAIAVSIIVIALGSGIGLSLASPFSSSPSTESLTIMGAVWLVLAQAIGFATGGYMAGRLRANPTAIHTGEVKFRDGANGLVVWAIGVVLSSILLAAAVNKAGGAAATTAGVGAAAVGITGASSQAPSLDYFTDALLRRTPQSQATATTGAAPTPAPDTNASGAAPGTPPNTTNNSAQRQEVGRILVTALGPSGLSNDDRTYLAQVVSARTGMSPDDAQKRVDDVINQAKADAAQAADTARKAGAYFSFWTFMSLLFGAACATLGGMLGGELRDEFAIRRAVPTAPR